MQDCTPLKLGAEKINNIEQLKSNEAQCWKTRFHLIKTLPLILLCGTATLLIISRACLLACSGNGPPMLNDICSQTVAPKIVAQI